MAANPRDRRGASLDGMVSRLLWDIVRESGEPMLLVGHDRQVLAATRAFHELVGQRNLEGSSVTCDRIIRPGAGGTGQPSCCLDALGGRGSVDDAKIWTIRRPDGAEIPVLCRTYPIRIDKSNVGAMLRLVPCRAGADDDGVFREAFLASMRLLHARLGGGRRYLFWLTRWIRKLCAPAYVSWLRLGPEGGILCEHRAGKLPAGFSPEDVQASLVAVGDLPGRQTPFDIWVRAGSSALPAHVFPAPQGSGQGLYLLLTGSDLDPWKMALLHYAVQAVDPGGEAAAASPPGAAGADHPAGLLTAASLSRREREVVSLIAQGCSDRVIADRLNLSTHTVKNHVRRIMEKLNVHKRAQVVLAVSDFSRFLPR